MSGLDLIKAQVAGFMAVEDTLINFRDERLSILGYANGVVVNERDGTHSSIVRMRTRHATDLAIATAAPLIEAQVRAQVAAEIETKRDGLKPVTFGGRIVAPSLRLAFTEAARIARGES